MKTTTAADTGSHSSRTSAVALRVTRTVFHPAGREIPGRNVETNRSEERWDERNQDRSQKRIHNHLHMSRTHGTDTVRTPKITANVPNAAVYFFFFIIVRGCEGIGLGRIGG
jgi:hypothetical protein